MAVVGIDNAYAQSDSISLREVEVTAIAQNSSFKASTPVQQLSAERMSALGIGSMAEALKHLSGITVRDYGGAGGMKTVSVRGIGARHTGVVYDGMAISDCQTGEIDLSRFDTDNTRSMTLAIGDADNIFVPARNAASPAALYIETIPDSAFAMARLGVGSWGTVSPSFKIAQPLGKAMLDLSASYLHSDNNYPFTLKNVKLITKEHRKNSRMDAGRIELGTRWHLNANSILSAKAYYYDNNRQLPGIVRMYTQDNDEHLRERNAFVQSSLRSTLSSSLSLMANAKVSWSESAYRVGVPSGGNTSQSYWQREYYGSAAMLYAPWRNLSFDYSVDFAHNNLNTTMIQWQSPWRNFLWQTISAKYSNSRLTAIARVLWTNCWDANDKSHNHENRIMPSVSLSYNILPHGQLMARMFWKSSLRMPTFNELYYYHIGSTDLKPERSSQWNIGLVSDTHIASSIGSIRIAATIDGYISNVEDKIIAIPFNMFVWRMMNLAKVRTLGIDASSNIAWTINTRHTLLLSANYTLQKAQNRSNPQSPYYNNQIAYTPVNTFATTLAWQNPWADIAATIDGMSKRWTTNEHSRGTGIPGFAEMDVNISRRFNIGKTNFKATASMLNITNKQYDLVAHYPMPGRSWRISLEAAFK